MPRMTFMLNGWFREKRYKFVATVLLSATAAVRARGGHSFVGDHDRAMPPDADASADDPTEETAANDQTSGGQSSEKKGSWLFAPIPINSPALGAGLQWAAARVFPIQQEGRNLATFDDRAGRSLHE